MTADREGSAYRGSDRRSLADDAPAGYRGPDRRGPFAASSDPLGLRYAVFGCAAAVLVFVAIRATLQGGRGQVVTFAALRDTGYGLLVLAGTVLLVVWALTGRAARALDGSALLLLGGGLLILGGPWGALFRTSQATALISPACRIALGLPALVVLIRSPSVVTVDSSIRPLRTLTSAAGCSLVLLGLESLGRLWHPTGDRAVWTTAMAVLTLGWVVAGARRVLSAGAGESIKGERSMGWAMITYGAGDALLVVTLHTSLGWGVAGATLQLFGAAGAATVAVSWLLAVLSRDGSRKLRLVGELAEVSTVLADEQSLRQRLLHDARNVVAAIRTASVTLERHGERLDPLVQEQLRDAVGSELVRLQALLEAPHEPVSTR